MKTPGDAPPTTANQLAERVARLLRHEVGDLLQGVYTTTAILSERLSSSQTQERQLLIDLKSRAEVCRHVLDAVVDLVSPPRVSATVIDLGSLISHAVAQSQRKFQSLEIKLEPGENLLVNVDVQASLGTLSFLLLTLCQTARTWIAVQLQRAGSMAICRIRHDGTPLKQEQLACLHEPTATTQVSLISLALSLTCRTIEPFGGTLAVVPDHDSESCVQLSLPLLDA